MMRRNWHQIVCILSLIFALPLEGYAQETLPADTVVVLPDTLNGDPQEEPADDPDEDIDPDALISPTLPLFGELVDAERPAMRPIEDVTELLHRWPGSFRHDLGEIGWPHGWSPYGLNPNRQDLLLNRRSYEDLVTGRPRYDLLPIDVLGRLYLRESPEGAPTGITTRIPDFDRAEPLTEIRYRRASNELASPMQGVNVFHTQRRRADFAGPAIVNIMASYAGRASDNTYPNSDLRAERNIIGRIRYRTPDYTLELRNHNARRRIGTRGSVIPTGGDFRTIYNVNLANTDPDFDNARRRAVHNDLSLTGQAPFPALSPELASGQIYWTRQFFRYENPPDTLDVQSDRVGIDALVPVSAGRHNLNFEAKAYVDSRSRPGQDTDWYNGIHVGVRDSVQLGDIKLESSGRIHVLGGSIHPTGSVDATLDAGRFTFGARLQRSVQEQGWLVREGVEPFVGSHENRFNGEVTFAQLRAGFSWLGLDVETSVFAHQTENATELVLSHDTQRATVEAFDEPLRRAGVLAALRWREAEPFGPYAVGHITGSVFPHHPDRSLPQRAYFTIPEVYGTGRIGWRTTLFQGDLDLNAFVQGRFWSVMRGRTFHPPSGLLALPPTVGRTAAIVPTDGTIDLQAEAEIRGATIFLAYDNALSGTVIQPGTFVSPIYPIPAQQFRIGVHWPILY